MRKWRFIWRKSASANPKRKRAFRVKSGTVKRTRTKGHGNTRNHGKPRPNKPYPIVKNKVSLFKGQGHGVFALGQGPDGIGHSHFLSGGIVSQNRWQMFIFHDQSHGQGIHHECALGFIRWRRFRGYYRCCSGFQGIQISSFRLFIEMNVHSVPDGYRIIFKTALPIFHFGFHAAFHESANRRGFTEKKSPFAIGLRGTDPLLE